MAQFDEHIVQVGRNLKFLQSINASIADCFDWQVTTCFYAAVHLANAHLSKHSLQFRTHNDVNFALNFANQLSVAKLPEEQYIAYTSLKTLSRRSRYLVNEKDDNIGAPKAFLTYDKHVAKAIKHLDCLLVYFQAVYGITLPSVQIKCSDIRKKEELKHISLVS